MLQTTDNLFTPRTSSLLVRLLAVSNQVYVVALVGADVELFIFQVVDCDLYGSH